MLLPIIIYCLGMLRVTYMIIIYRKLIRAYEIKKKLINIIIMYLMDKKKSKIYNLLIIQKC